MSPGAPAAPGAVDWTAAEAALEAAGHAVVPALLDAVACRELAALYDEPRHFRAQVDMARYRLGLGDYRYFAEPLPPLVAALREGLYPRLAAVANRWQAALGLRERFPPELAGLRALCARHGQRRPTPLLLRYGPGGHNCLHQDLYGAVAFPFQLTVLLSRPGADFTGGEFLLVEQRPRAQSRAEVVPLGQGDGVIFPTRYRPVPGRRGAYRATLRHGVSRVREGRRLALGVIFHDAA
jgi:hypothetical protein